MFWGYPYGLETTWINYHMSKKNTFNLLRIQSQLRRSDPLQILETFSDPVNAWDLKTHCFTQWSNTCNAVQQVKTKNRKFEILLPFSDLFKFLKNWRSNLTKAVASNHASCGLYPLEVGVVVALRRTDFIDFRMAPKETIEETIHAYILKWFSNLLQPDNGNHNEKSIRVLQRWCTSGAGDEEPPFTPGIPRCDLSLQRVAKGLSIELSGFFPVNLTHVAWFYLQAFHSSNAEENVSSTWYKQFLYNEHWKCCAVLSSHHVVILPSLVSIVRDIDGLRLLSFWRSCPLCRLDGKQRLCKSWGRRILSERSDQTQNQTQPCHELPWISMNCNADWTRNDKDKRSANAF